MSILNNLFNKIFIDQIKKIKNINDLINYLMIN